MLEDLCRAGSERGPKGITLGYFNTVGDGGSFGGPLEKRGPHLIARLLGHCAEDPFVLTGTEFPTRDGTGIRDYFHVADLALAHLAVLERFDGILQKAGSGKGVNVREFIGIFERVSGKTVCYREGPPRPGDVAGGFARTERLREMTGGEPRFSLEEAVESALAWEEKGES